MIPFYELYSFTYNPLLIPVDIDHYMIHHVNLGTEAIFIWKDIAVRIKAHLGRFDDYLLINC